MRIPNPITVEKLSPPAVLLEIEVSEDLVFFPGHFPQQSVLPGVVMVDWAVDFAQQFLPVAIAFKTMEAVKFRQVIVPPATVWLRLEYKEKTGKLHFSYEDDQEQVLSSGRVSQARLLES